MSEEVTNLWRNKLSSPHVSNQVIHTKLHKVLKTYDECIRRGKIDIIKVNGQWLSIEDKRLYQLHLESIGEVGYSTSKVARKETIHPSKRQKLPTESISKSVVRLQKRISRKGCCYTSIYRLLASHSGQNTTFSDGSRTF
ncbi:hypothetical protein L9F63_001362 [Diploptera punctata]|uniref:Uncharacterized protein n=1 Tax=Diploptera punctata TaxID=6984 RepID=A0AAD8A460_DIPPU|nr:hypothetical protein L9F63_001362 [Diploptera punctata]